VFVLAKCRALQAFACEDIYMAFLQMIGHFCGYVGLFAVYRGLVQIYRALFHVYSRSAVHCFLLYVKTQASIAENGALLRYIGLFCRYLGLCCIPGRHVASENVKEPCVSVEI